MYNMLTDYPEWPWVPFGLASSSNGNYVEGHVGPSPVYAGFMRYDKLVGMFQYPLEHQR